jgi:hypothetical protein
MTTTPRLWKSQTQVNATDSGPNGEAQVGGQIAALEDGGYVVVWADNSGAFNPSGTALVAQRYSSAGNKVGGEVHLTNSFPGSASSPAVTVLANGNLAVAFVGDLFNFGFKDTFVRIFSPSLTLIRTDTIDNGPTQPGDPSITALANGGYAVSYTVDDTQIVGRVVSPTGVLGPGFGLGGSTHSELATLSNGNFVVVHEVSSSVTLEVFTPNADPVAAVPGVDSGSGLDPDVAALRGGGFVVVWTDPASTGGDIRATIFSNDTGVPDFDAFQFRVNTSTAGAQNEASVAALDDGGFLVTWENDNADLVRAQRFDAVGNKIGVEFTVKIGVSVDSPEVGVLSDGGIAFAVGDVSTGDPDVMTSIWTTGWPADPHVHDFNADGWSDILWRNDNGAASIWQMNAAAVVAAPSLGTISTDWHIANVGDFNGDDRNDILWRNELTGGTSLWEMNGGQLLAPPISLGNVGTDWHIDKAGGDFNGDGNATSCGATSIPVPRRYGK